jgi:DNA-damage-inducible protein J
MESTSTNITIRIDKETKRDFENFCDNVGINLTTAFNMFVKATLRTRTLPFIVSDNSSMQARQEIQQAFEALQKESVANGNDKMSMDEINSIISECRQEKGFND